MSEAEFDIDAAEAAYNEGREDAGDPPPADDGNIDDGAGDPPGFKTFEEYVADGGDPDDYVGKKAYERHHARIQDNKGLRDEVKGLRDTVQQTVDATNTMLEQSEARIRVEVEEELRQAKEDEDVSAALGAQKKLDDMDSAKAVRQQQAATTQQGEHPEIAAARQATPMLDATSDQFDAEFNEDVESIFNSYAQKGLTVSDSQVKRVLAVAVKEAKALHAEKFESTRNNRQQQKGGERQQRRAAAGDQTPTAESYVIDNPRNPRQKNAAPEVRDMIREKAENAARKAGKSDADITKAGKEAATKFEKSLRT